jgi:hypothetical protein
MDSNATRRAHKAKMLTNNQFIRHLSKIPVCFPCKANVDIEPLIYVMLLAQSVLDLKVLSRNENVKYPLGIMYVSIYQLLSYFNREFKIVATNKDYGTEYYFMLNQVESGVREVISKFSYLMLGTLQTLDRTNLVKVLNGLGGNLANLCVSLNFTVEHIAFTGAEFFKTIVPTPGFIDYIKTADRLSNFRNLYLDTRTREGQRTSRIEQYLQLKFEEVSSG